MKSQNNKSSLGAGSDSPPPQGIGASHKYLCFSIGKDKFAIPLLQVKEVIADGATTAIPKSPPYFKGIMNLRGQIISVIDLRLKLKPGKFEKTAETTIVILDLAPLSVGVVVDSVDSVVAYADGEISPTPHTDSSLNVSYITGVARSDNTLTLVLDLKAVLTTEDFKAMKSHGQRSA